MGRSTQWSSAQNTVVQKVLKRARHRARVILIPGNQDEALREYVGSRFGNVHVVLEAIHTAADSRRYLLVHGDEFDQVTRYHRWLAVLGDRAYAFLAAIKDIDGIRYVNCGDWVDSCTAIVEHQDERLELIEWGKAGDPQVPVLILRAEETAGGGA